MGKPLADIGGKPMIQHTYESAKKARLLDEVVVATDDARVADAVNKFGGRVMLTPNDLATGSDRIAWVANKLSYAEILVNIQGDEPFIQGRMIDEAVEPLFFDPTVSVSTLAKRIMLVEELHDPSIPKVVFDYHNFAMYFSRSPIPYARDAQTDQQWIDSAEVYKHIGLYVYRREALLKFTQLAQTDLERIEKLEQLRMLENGMKIKIVVTDYESMSVDTPEDLHKARLYYKSLHRHE